MPSKSKAQQRFFGMVDAYKKGEMKNASSKIKKAADGMSMSDVKDFAETKHKGLPEKVEENIIRLTENDLHRMVMEVVNRMITERREGDHEFVKGKDGYSQYYINHGNKTVSAIHGYPRAGKSYAKRHGYEYHDCVDESVEMEDVPQDHIFSEKEMQWLYDNQDKLSPIQQKVLNAGMWVRARQANYHGYAKRWSNIILKNGETYYYESNGKIRKTGT